MIDSVIALIYYITIVVISIHVVPWIYKELTMGICRCKGSLKGKVVLITGGNNGIGFETSLELVRRGAKLIIGCRNTQNVEHRICDHVPGANVEVHKLDLSSSKSIRAFADEIKSKYDSIDILINNAGMVNKENKRSVDGYELVMATNYLGHALLNHLLMDLVKRAGQAGSDCSRIILVSSLASGEKKAANHLCSFNSSKKNYDINFESGTLKELGSDDFGGQYGKSKLAQIMYGKHLAKTLKDENCNTMVASLHPGFVRTDIFQGLPAGPRLKFIMWAGYTVGKSCLQGAQTTIYLALCDPSQIIAQSNGHFFSDCRSKNWFNSLLPKAIDDPVACKALWDETMRLLKV